jgi:GDP-L-fucose synthase
MRAKVWVTASRGLLGSAFVRALSADERFDLVSTHRKTLDFFDAQQVRLFLSQERPDIVIHTAALVGGIKANIEHPVDFINTNLKLNLNLLEELHRYQRGKALFFGSNCMYPTGSHEPLPESSLGEGAVEPTNSSYAIAKLALYAQISAYRKQYDAQLACLIPASMFGPNDLFHEEYSHFVPALIHKLHQAKVTAAPSLTLWGSGEPRREVILVDDVTRSILQLLDHPELYQGAINIGTERDHSIKELAQLVAQIIGYTGELTFDRTKPDGAYRKLLSSERMRELRSYEITPLEQGISQTYKWYLEALKQNNLRGIHVTQ